MNDFQKLKLSGSTNGKPIQITGTDSGGSVIIHTATNTTDTFDEVWVYANNVGTSSYELTIYTDSDTDANRIIVGIPYKKGLIYVLPGITYDGGVVLRAYAGEANKINIHGWVNRIVYSS